MDGTKTLISLTNPPFTFQFADKEYQIRKANIRQVQQYQLRVEELANDKTLIPAVRDLKIVAYSVFLLLNSADSSITEECVEQNMPATKIDGLQLLGDLGFIDPVKVALIQKYQEKLISQNSTQQ
jgi:hypothetical protein